MLALITFAFTTCVAQFWLVGASNSPSIQLRQTTLVGRDVSILKQDFFGGIPYAEPPLGRLRLKPPVLKTNLKDGTFNASNFGASCLQTDLPLNEMSEDCLTINIFRPSKISTKAKLPVLFWTYGGGWVNGTSSAFNGSAIVAQSVARGTPVIYVNFNYRLGPLGFPQGWEAADKKALNLGLKDIITALEWVQLNIGAFGGDKDKVTMFGKSAGAVMTSLLYFNSPERWARAAIFESGSQASGPLMKTAVRDDDWHNFVDGIPSCHSKAKPGSTFECVQSADTSQIFQGLFAAATESKNFFIWDPTVDGPGGLIPDLPSVLLEQGKFARLPFIGGTNQDEGTLFAALWMGEGVNSTQQIKNWVTAYASPPVPSQDSSINTLLQLYPDVPALGSPFNTGNELFGLSSQWKRASAVVGDIMFHSQRRYWMETAAKSGVKTFGYLFTQPQSSWPPELGVPHSSEIPFVYGSPTNPSASDSLLSRMMIDYWLSFATSLDPNDGLGVARPKWDQYTPKHKVLMQLNGDNTSMIPDDFRKDQMAFIDSHPEVWNQ
ncbi:extracellular triacylglycerol lipase precursor [Mycena epipterygia]|nr:extracellular triacylglycerol lipase precursor [Mycena epipterygia]